MRKLKKVLIIEDDKNIRRFLQLELEHEGYKVIIGENGEIGINKFKNETPDIILLDLMMPILSGEEVCKIIRKTSEIPIIILTAKDQTLNKIELLDMGADDYITKPFRIAELRARVNAHLRREQRERHSTLIFERIKFDLAAKELWVAGNRVTLTKSEYLICEYLARNKGQVFTKEQIYEAVFGLDGDSDNSTIATHIKNIRAKLEKLNIQPISTVWGIGYKWE